ncbi:MAG: glycerol dehydratase reactivase beta/small subunit family protein [Spirochaetaceae bacterium]|jgi:hypothetical protein|nr:glycerol dehydratase reactivase beta/small subunit family protein [Spirochaetaceae bacterium]
MKTDAAIPSIKVIAPECFEDAALVDEILFGIEEEGVPFELERTGGGSASALAYQGALDSELGVGIGVDSGGFMAVHYNKLPPEKPLFTVRYTLDRDLARTAASNAARLVKGIPFMEAPV